MLEQLYTIVNTRYEDGRAILITTNLIDKAALEAQIGERTVSRLFEICGEVHRMQGADHRLEVEPPEPTGPELEPPEAEFEATWEEPAYGEARPRRPRLAS